MSRDAHINALPMPIIYVQHLAREFPSLELLLADSGLSPADLECADRTISVRADLQCVANAMAMASAPVWYHDWALRLAENYHGPLSTAWLNAPTLGSGLEVFLRYFPRRIPYMEIRSYDTPAHLVIEFAPLLDVGDLLPLLIEVPMLILQRYIGIIRNKPMAGATVEVSYAAPPDAGLYGRTFECPLAFGRGANRLLLPREWLDIRNLTYNEPAWRAGLEQCAQWAARNTPRDIINSVRREFFAALEHTMANEPMPTLTSVAQTLNISPRTLIRRLQSLGTTFSDELDDVRRLRAQALLAGGLQIGQVATLLKYKDTTSFSKAFRRWFGVAPSRYRLAAQDPE